MQKTFAAILIAALSTLCSSGLHAQWTTVNTGTIYDLNAIAFNGNTIFLGGLQFVKSTDGGATWTVRPLLDDQNVTIFSSELHDLHFFDQNTGVATGFILTGNSEVILRTTNGGVNWSFVNVNNGGAWPRLLNDIDFPTATTGYAVGTNGRILKSTNAGQNWTALNSGTAQMLNAVHFFNANTGIAVGAGIILRTTNGGANWTAQNFPGHNLLDLHFLDANTGVASGTAGLLKTTNGGISWTPVNGSFSGNAVYMLSADTVFVGGDGIAESINGGAYFLPQPSVPTGETFNKLDFFNGTTGYAVGEDGLVRRTTSFGDPFPLNDASALEIEEFPTNPCPDVFPVRVRIKNIGLHNLTQATINWEVNGQPQPPFAWTGNLAAGDTSAFITLGSYFFSFGNNAVKVWTSGPNGATDDDQTNDTQTVVFALKRLSGSYTIGGANADFPTVKAAIDALWYPGVCGSVVFNIRNGVYAEENTLLALQHATDDYDIVFQSESGNPANVVLTTPPNSIYQYPTLVLDGVKHVTIRNITIKSNGGVTQNRPLVIKNGASDIQILDNVLEGKQGNLAGDEFAVIKVEGPACSNLVFKNNTIRFGSTGLLLGATAAAPGAGNRVEGNIFQNQYYRGLCCSRQKAVTVTGNSVTASSVYNSVYGIVLASCFDTFSVFKNTIRMEAGGGLGLLNCNDGGGSGRVYNNFIHIEETTGQHNVYVNGIKIEDSYNLNIDFNTVRLKNAHTNSSASICVSMYMTNPNVVYAINIRNNIFSNSSAGAVYRISHSIFPISVKKVLNSIDHNAYNFKGVVFAEADVDEKLNIGLLTSLAEWRIVLNKDFNSVELDPQFSGDVHIVPQTTNYGLSGAAIPIPGINEDIDGEPRDPLRPDIGADEFAHPALDAGAGALFQTVRYCAGSGPVYASIKNYGTDTLHSVTVNWSVNNVQQSPYAWSGALPTGAESDTLHLGNFNFTGGVNYAINVWTGTPNGAADHVPANDGIFANTTGGGMAGTYTIGGAGADFPTFNAAKNALVSSGVCRPVRFLVRSGVYNEQVSFPEIPGASAENTISFEAENGYAQSVLLTYSASSAANYTLQLDGADYLIFQNLSFTAANNTDYNTILFLKNGACHNRFLNNRFLGLPTPQNYNWHYPIHSAASLDEYNLFEGNTIINGTNGIWMKGGGINAGPVYRYERGNRFVNNTISGAKHKSMYLEFQQDPVVEKNTIDLAIPFGEPYTNGGIQLSSAIGNIRVLANKAVGSAESGIWMYGVRSSIRERGLIANNFVSLTSETGIGVNAALVLGQCFNQDVFCNNLMVYGVENSRALDLLYAPMEGIVARNNNFVNRTPAGSAVSAPHPNTLVASDYNNFYSENGKLVLLPGGWYADLASLQASTGFDIHSLDVDPLFVSNTDLHLTAGSPVLGAGGPVAAIPADFDGELRDPATPDIGADEYSLRPELSFENLAFTATDPDGWNMPVSCGNAVPVVIPCDSTGVAAFNLRANVHCSLDSCFATGVKWFVFQGITLVAEGQVPLSWADGQDISIEIQNLYALFTPNTPYTLTLQYDCGMCSPCACTVTFVVAPCGACECLSSSYSGLQFKIDGGAVHPAQCNQQLPVPLSCPKDSGLNFSFEGNLHCTDACATTVDWEIRNTFFNSVVYAGTATLNAVSGSQYRFKLPSMAFSKFQMPGTYKLFLNGHCGAAECACAVPFYLSICDVCTCPALQNMQFVTEGNALPVQCNNQDVLALSCPDSAATFSFEGTVRCSDSCEAKLNYRVLSFNDQQLWSGNAAITPLGGNLYRFRLNGIPYNALSTFAYNRLELQAVCSGRFCSYCSIYFSIPECDFCCIYPADFEQAVSNATALSIDNIACKATLQIGDLPNCGDYIGAIDWGDGTVDAGPYGANSAPEHTYAQTGNYAIAYTAYEPDGSGQVCFEKQFRDTISVNCQPCDFPALAVGLTGYFPFNGNANDASPTKKNGTITGATLTAGHDGKPNSAYRFNGSSSMIECSGDNRGVSNAVSVFAWVKTTEQSKVQWVAGKYEGYYLSGGRGYRLAIGNEYGNDNIGKAGFGGIDGSTPLFQSSGYGTTSVNDGQWHCLVGVAGNQTWKIYVDGKLESSAPGGTTNLANATSRPLSIGGFSPPVYPVWMNGDIDNVRIYNRALTDHEVECLCSGDSTTRSRDLILQETIALFPNPTTGGVTLQFEHGAPQAAAVRIFDAYGQLLLDETLPAGVPKHAFSVALLPAGVYILQIEQEGRPVWLEKLVKL